MARAGILLALLGACALAGCGTHVSCDCATPALQVVVLDSATGQPIAAPQFLDGSAALDTRESNASCLEDDGGPLEDAGAPGCRWTISSCYPGTFDCLVPGAHHLTVSADGYASVAFDAAVSEGTQVGCMCLGITATSSSAAAQIGQGDLGPVATVSLTHH